MTHLTFAQISELAEREKPDGPGADHLGRCAECREIYGRVSALLATARTLPHDVAPPPETWAAVRARVRAETARRSTALAWRPWLAAAASILIIAVGALLLRGRTDRAKGATIAVAPPVSAVLAVDRNYAGTILELRATLNAQRGRLAPGTIRTVERSLTVIDSAIAEARAALAADPGSQALTDILSAHYEREVDLLQRAAELSSL